MTKYLSVFTFLILTTAGFSQNCDLFFSEYLEGSSNNKAVEIYNPLNTAVDLADYKIYRYNNGSPTPTDSLQMVGNLNPGAVYVAGNPSAIASILSVSDTLHTITFFNGDDVLELRYMPTGTSLDIIGIIGVDPGTNWPVGSGATSEFTLVRQLAHTDGELNWAICVNEWDVYPQNTDTFLGSHSGSPCCSATSSSLNVTSCASYTWAQNNTTYTVSGAYTDTIPNAAGCDSIITLNLTINMPTTAIVTTSACESYFWSQNNQTYTVSGMYNNTISNAAGCDSVITLDLTINMPTTAIVTGSACESYLWSQNNQTYTVSGMYNDTISNAAGCDSIIVLDLTITGFTATATDNGDATLTASSGSTYQWINCLSGPILNATSQTYTTTENGDYAVMVTNADGCSSTSLCVPINYIGLQEIEGIQIHVFPNPTNNFLIVNMSTSITLLEVRDSQGKLLQTLNIQNGDKIDLESYQTGVYFLSFQTENGLILRRITKL